MAGSVNKVMIIGNLGADPDVRTTPSGATVANLSVATSESWNDRDGNRQEKTEWHRVVLWNKLAELAQRYLRKGRKVYIEGRLETRSWDDQQTGQRRYMTEIRARDMVFLDSGRAGGEAGYGSGYGAQQQGGYGGATQGGGGYGGPPQGGGYGGAPQGGGGYGGAPQGGGGGYGPPPGGGAPPAEPSQAPAGQPQGEGQAEKPTEDPGYFDDDIPF